MSHIASLCTSRMGLSTSISGYLRFFIQVDSADGRTPTLFITRNMGIDDNSRTNTLSNFNLVCHLYYFLILVLFETHGSRILPPDLRENDFLLFFPSTMNKRSNFLLCHQFLPRLALTRISGHLRSIWFNLLAALWELTLHCCGNHVIEDVGSLRVELVEGKLERVLENGLIKGYVTHPLHD